MKMKEVLKAGIWELDWAGASPGLAAPAAQGTRPPWARRTRIPHKFRNPSVNKALLTTFHTVKK